MIALAQGLRVAGHAVTISISRVDANDEIPADYATLAPSVTLEFRHAGRLHYASPEQRKLASKILATRNPIRQVENMLAGLFDPMAAAIDQAARDLCRDNDIVIGNYLAYSLSAAAAKSNCPMITVQFLPGLIPTAERPPHGFPNLGRRLNPLLWHITSKAIGRAFLPRINAVRSTHGLAPIRDFLREGVASPLLTLVAASPSLSPPMPDWPTMYVACGFLDVPVPENAQLPGEDLEAFLRAGPPPVFMTGGSMLLGDVEFERIAGIFVEAARLAGCRAIVQAPWNEIHGVSESPDVFRVTGVPHGLVFPRCAAVVHHGGAGTCQSATLAGCPSVVVVYGFDQGYWSGCLQAAGVALGPLRRQTLRANDLAARIRRTLASLEMKARAEALGQAMREEDGVGRAVALIEKAWASRQSGARDPN